MQRENYYKRNNYFNSVWLKENCEYIAKTQRKAEHRGIKWQKEDFLGMMDAIAEHDHNKMILEHTNEVARHYIFPIDDEALLSTENLRVAFTHYIKNIYQKLLSFWSSEVILEEMILINQEAT